MSKRGTVRRTIVGAAALAFLTPASFANANIVPEPISFAADADTFEIKPLGTYATGIFDQSAAEVVDYHAASQRLLVVNAAQATVEVLSVADAAAPVKLFDLQTTGVAAEDGSLVLADAVANSVAVRADGLGVVAVENVPKTGAGWIVFFDAAGSGSALGAVRVGALPDMVTFSPDGSTIIVANEGEPADDYSVDPEGTVSLIAAPQTVAAAPQSAVRTADFREFEVGGSLTLPDDVRIFGGRQDAGTGTPEFPVAENLEPEYATFSANGATAWVSLQEANAIAVVDTANARVTGILPLGTVNRMSVPIDASDADGAIDIRSWPVLGMYQPDTIASYEVDGENLVVTANEGDSRDWTAYSEVARVEDLGADGLAPVCDDAFGGVLGSGEVPETLDGLVAEQALGRLNITTATGLSDDASCYEELYTYGSRSFSIWDADGAQVFDSADAFEQLVASVEPEFFNSSHTESSFDGRSDDKGPEPEGLALGEIDGRTYAFIGFERVGGIAAFDISDPEAVKLAAYVNNRNFAASVDDDPAALAVAGDLGPEGLRFIAAADSPTGTPLVAVGNEVSGTTTLFEVRVPAVAGGAPVPVSPAVAGVPAAPEPSPGRELAATGVDANALWMPVGALLLVGSALLVFARRRATAPADGTKPRRRPSARRRGSVR